MQHFSLSVIIPLISVIVVAVLAGTIGIVFMVAELATHSENLVIIMGVALVVLVPLIAYLLERKVAEPG